MSWFGIGKEISEPLKALDDLFTSDEERAQAEFVLEQLKQKPLLMQAMINKEQAIKGSFFHAGWRSMAGWVCVSGLFYASIVAPVLDQLFLFEMPRIDTSLLINLLLGMLGLAGFRTYEKKQGIAKQ